MIQLNSLVLDHGPVVAAFALFTVYAVRALLFAGGAQLWTRASVWARHHLVVLPKDQRVDFLRDVKRGAAVLAMDASVFALLVFTHVFRPERNCGPLEDMAWVSGLFVWFELYFYFSHRALHHPRLYPIHRFHHEGRGTNPWTSLAFSFSERAVLHVGAFVPLSLLSHYLAVPLDGVGLYFLLNYALNVYGHMNVEIAPRWLPRTPLFNVMNTSVSHSLHHLRFKGHYGLFTRFLDRWLGTDFGDYEQVYERVMAGQGALKPRLGKQRAVARVETLPVA